MNPPFRLVVGSDIAEIPGVSARLEEVMGRNGFSSEEILDTQLAVEEVVTNTIVHGYRSTRGEIKIVCRFTGDRAVIEISDTAPAFDPLSLPDPDFAGELGDRKIGGLGVFLVRQLMDEVRYRREGGRNILTVVKKRKP